MAKQTVTDAKSKKKAKSLQAVADLAAQQALEDYEASADESDFIDDEEGYIDSELETEGIEPSVPDEQDVFIEAFKKAQKSNETAKYSIYRNGEMLATKYHPYSWEQLQAEYGAGHYKIVARNSRGHYLTAQSQLVGSPTNEPAKPEVAAQPANQGLNFLEMWTLMKEEKEKAEKETREQANNAATVQAKMFETMMLMSQQSQQQMQTMFMTMMQQMNNNTVQMFQGMNERVNMMSNKKDDGIDAVKLQELLQKAEQRAEERMRFMFEQIETKAEAMAEEKAELLANQDDGDKESMTTQLIKGFIPLIAGAAQGAMIGHEQNHPHLPAPLSPTPVAQAPVAQAAQPKTAPVAPPIKAAQPQPLPVTPIQVKQAPIKQAPKEPAKEKPVSEVKKAILELSLPLIGNGLLKRQNPKEVAAETMKTLEKVGITRQNVISEFSFDDILNLAKEYNIPALAHPWLKEFHEALSTNVNTAPQESGKSPSDSGGEPVKRTKGK